MLRGGTVDVRTFCIVIESNRQTNGWPLHFHHTSPSGITDENTATMRHCRWSRSSFRIIMMGRRQQRSAEQRSHGADVPTPLEISHHGCC